MSKLHYDGHEWIGTFQSEQGVVCVLACVPRHQYAIIVASSFMQCCMAIVS